MGGALRRARRFPWPVAAGSVRRPAGRRLLPPGIRPAAAPARRAARAQQPAGRQRAAGRILPGGRPAARLPAAPRPVVRRQARADRGGVELEKKQHARDPLGKRSRLTQVFIEKGVSPNLAEAVVRQISADRDRAVATHLREELGIDADDLPSPRTAALASLASFTVGALLPLSPFLAGYPSLSAALALAGASAFAGGAAVAQLTGRSSPLGGLRQFTAAFLATGMAFVIGHLVGAHVG